MSERLKVQKGLSASTLKWIAIVSMLIDHFAIAVYSQLDCFTVSGYHILRKIGRIAFPIYCFLLVEGFFYTHDVRKYIRRCFMFAFISEVPFDLAMHGTVWYPQSQNVYFTLTLGLCTLYAISHFQGNAVWHPWAQAVCVIIGAGIAQILEVDYHCLGVVFIVMFYYCRSMEKWLRDIIGAIAFSYEVTAPLAFIPIHLYNGKRGMKLKYFFYWVYPVHLLIYGVIRLHFMKG